VCLAQWQTDVRGLDWLCELVRAGKAIDLGGNGYPCWFTATAEHLLPRINETPPGARAIWSRQGEPFDFVSDKWAGKTVIDREAMAQCRPDEWLLVEAWDES
jgi:hypothetical protein